MANNRHGAFMRNKRLYSTWITMIHRCEDPKREKYKDYGGRGISVCEEWHDPNSFIDWAYSNGYHEGLQIDRINNDMGYSPDNCRWVTNKVNSRNRRNTVYLSMFGERKCVSEWCETLPISQNTIYWWVREFGIEYTQNRITDIVSRFYGKEFAE